MNAPAVVSHSVRTMFIRSSISRTMDGRRELRLCSILSPVKKVKTNSARESAFIFGRSTSIFLAMSCFSLVLLRVMMPKASGLQPSFCRPVLASLGHQRLPIIIRFYRYGPTLKCPFFKPRWWVLDSKDVRQFNIRDLFPLAVTQISSA